MHINQMERKPPPSLVQELVLTPDIIGRIRAGMQVLTMSSTNDKKAVAIYEDGLKNGLSFKRIEDAIKDQCKIKNPLRPDNTEYFNVRNADFHVPGHAQLLLDLYGEVRSHEHVKRLYRIPVVFPFNEIEQIMPNSFSVWSALKREYFSEYDQQGNRLCLQYAEPIKTEQSQRVVRFFGSKRTKPRIDEHINRICDPEACPQFQAKKCNLDLSLLFLIPGIKGSGVVKAHSTSIISLKQWYSTLSLVKMTKGSLRNVNFYLEKKLMDINFTDQFGKAQKSKQWITILTTDIDLPQLLLSTDAEPQLLLVDNSTELEQEISHEMPTSFREELMQPRSSEFESYIRTVQLSDESPKDKKVRILVAHLKYLKIDRPQFNVYAMTKHGPDWVEHVDLIDIEIEIAARSTQEEMNQMISDII